MNVLYYYYYLFYTRVLPDDEPHATVIFTLSFSESLLVNYSIDLVGAHLFCKFLLGKWSMIIIFVMIMVVNYLIYHKTGKNKKVVENKPKFFNSRVNCYYRSVLFDNNILPFLDGRLPYVCYRPMQIIGPDQSHSPRGL